MPVFIRSVALLVALLSLSLGANAVECDIGKLLGAFEPVKANANYATCQSKLKPNIQICSVAACKSLIAPMAALSLPNCTFSRANAGFSLDPVKLKKRLTSELCEKPGNRVVLMRNNFYQRVVKRILHLMQ